jgi:hypothetical protein
MKRLLGLGFLLCASAAHAEELMGTWNLTSQPSTGEPGINTCGTKIENAAYQWIITRNADRVTVKVQGQTSFPDLEGKILEESIARDGKTTTGFTFIVEGQATAPTAGVKPSVYYSSVFRLTSEGKSLSGNRLLVGWKDRVDGGKSLCVSEWAVTGTKQ